MTIIEQGTTLSLMITAIYYSMQSGEIFSGLADFLDRAIEAIGEKIGIDLWPLTKPLYRCNICMGGFWTLVLYPAMWGWNWAIIPTALTTIGLNTVMAAILKYLDR